MCTEYFKHDSVNMLMERDWTGRVNSTYTVESTAGLPYWSCMALSDCHEFEVNWMLKIDVYSLKLYDTVCLDRIQYDPIKSRIRSKLHVFGNGNGSIQYHSVIFSILNISFPLNIPCETQIKSHNLISGSVS